MAARWLHPDRGRRRAPVVRDAQHELEGTLEALQVSRVRGARTEDQQVGGRCLAPRASVGRTLTHLSQVPKLHREGLGERGLVGNDPDGRHRLASRTAER